MVSIRHNPIVRASEFLRSTRESGYRGTPLALAELIDNSIEAGAKTVEVRTIPTPESITAAGDNNAKVDEIVVIDDGSGMNVDVLGRALSFGGSSRFDSRTGMGRFGMGLPNSSLSQCTHVEVYSWQGGAKPNMIAMDVDEVVKEEATELPPPRPLLLPVAYRPMHDTKSGTAVVWKRCDRVDRGGKVLDLLPKLRNEFGRIYRHLIAGGAQIVVGGDRVKPLDPLYLMKEAAIEGDKLAEEFGAAETITIPIPGKPGESGKVVVRCSILPSDWQFAWRHNTIAAKEAKEARHLASTVGISIVRSGRELQIAKNPYHARHWTDSWYRVEVQFGPELDEVFGVTHTKQAITLETGSPAFNYLEGTIVPRVQEMRRIIVERREKLQPKAAVPGRTAGTPDKSERAASPDRLVAASTVGAPLDIRKEPGALDTFEGPVDILAEHVRGKNPRINRNHPYFKLYEGLPLTAKVAANPFIKAAAALDDEMAEKFGHKLKLVMTRKKTE